MKDESTVNPRHGDDKSREEKQFRQVIQFMRCDLSNLASDIKCYLEIRRVGITDNQIEEDRKIKEHWESRIGKECDKITEAVQFLRYNVLGK